MIETQESQNGEINSSSKKDIEDKRSALKKLCTNNADYFSRDSSENGQRLYISFLAMNDAVDALWPKISNIEEHVKEFDFDEETPGNGYRSYLHVVNLAIDLATDLNKKVLLRRESVLFRKTTLTKYVLSPNRKICEATTLSFS